MKNSTQEKTELLKNPLVQQIAEEFYESGYDDWKDFTKNQKPKKEWEILSLAYQTTEKGPWIYNEASIHSVKRLSDRKIFTVGDRIWSPKWASTTDNDSIKSIRIAQQHEFGDTKKGDIVFVTHIGYQQNLRHSFHFITKTPLFITEDGVKIFENDLFYVVNKQFFTIEERWGGSYHKKHVWVDFVPVSTKEAAENWIVLNRPCLSIKDIMEYIKEQGRIEWHKGHNSVVFNSYFQNLKSLVKNRFNK